MPDVIVNTSPLLYLHQGNLLNILHQLYDVILVPKAVENELLVGYEQGYDVPHIRNISWLSIVEAKSSPLISVITDLGQGEAEVIALGIGSDNSILIIDDQLGRRIAELHDLKYTGTLGVLIKAKQAGYLVSVERAIATLRTKGMWLSDLIVEEALRLAGEK